MVRASGSAVVGGLFLSGKSWFSRKFLFIAISVLVSMYNLCVFGTISFSIVQYFEVDDDMRPVVDNRKVSMLAASEDKRSHGFYDDLSHQGYSDTAEDAQKKERKVSQEFNEAENEKESKTTLAVARDDGEDDDVRIAFITFSSMENMEGFENTVLAAARTWVPADEFYYVVLNRKWEDTFGRWKDALERSELVDTNTNTHGTSTRVSLSSNPSRKILPLFVDCAGEKVGMTPWGASPCCKQEQGLVRFYEDHLSRHNTSISSNSSVSTTQNRRRDYNWIYFSDDDVYVNVHVLKEYIRILPLGLPQQRDYILQGQPLVLVGHIHAMPLGRYGYLRHGDHVYYKCSEDDENFRYPWGNPVVYNRAALETIMPGLKQGGLVRQCVEFDHGSAKEDGATLTAAVNPIAQDVGNALLHWMYSLPSVVMTRGANLKTSSVSHLHRQRDRAALPGGNLFDYRGDIGFIHGAGKVANFTMDFLHEQRYPPDHKKPFAKGVPLEKYFLWRNVDGFNQTDTYRQFGSPRTWKDRWHVMPVSDCNKGKAPPPENYDEE